jgi:hypothetical protein
MARAANGTRGQARDLARMRQRLDDWRGSHKRGVAIPPEAVVRGGTSGSAARGVRDGAGAGPGIQQTQRDERCDCPGTRQGEAAVETRSGGRVSQAVYSGGVFVGTVYVKIGFIAIAMRVPWDLVALVWCAVPAPPRQAAPS